MRVRMVTVFLDIHSIDISFLSLRNVHVFFPLLALLCFSVFPCVIVLCARGLFCTRCGGESIVLALFAEGSLTPSHSRVSETGCSLK